MMNMKGVFAALFTPFDERDEVSEERLRTHVEFLIEKGLHGLYVCGNSGQGLYMSVAERQRVLEIVKDQVKGRVTIIAHIAAMATRDARALVTHANELGVDAIASLPPVYWNHTPDEIVQYYRDINADNKLPCFIYHIPELSGQISRETMLKLGEIEQICGLKYTDTNFFILQDLLQQMKGKWIAFSGPDQLFLPALTMGVVGSIGSNQNVYPELFVSIYNDFMAGNIDRARKTQALVTRLLVACNAYGSITATKAMLKLRGHDPGFARRPLQPSLPADTEQALMDEIRSILQDCELIEVA